MPGCCRWHPTTCPRPRPRCPSCPAQAPDDAHLTLQGVIAGSGSAPPVALLAEAGKRPVLVAEGSSFGEDIRVERVLPDRAVLRWRGSNAPIVVRHVAGGWQRRARHQPDISSAQPPAPTAGGCGSPRPDDALPGRPSAGAVRRLRPAAGTEPDRPGPLSGPAPGSTN